nr:unnamed protein product [Papilio xuthus]
MKKIEFSDITDSQSISFANSTNKTIDEDDDFSSSDDKYDVSDFTISDYSDDDESDSCSSVYPGTSNCLLGFDSSDLILEPEYELLEHIVKETNLYAFQKFLKIEESEQLSTPRKHMSSWKPVSLGEMKVFFGIVLIMGLNHLPRMKFYWSKNEMWLCDNSSYFHGILFFVPKKTLVL